MPDERRRSSDREIGILIGQMSEALPLLHRMAGEIDHIDRRVGRLESQYEHEVLPALKKGGNSTATSDSEDALTVNARFKNWKWPLAVLGIGGGGIGIGAWAKGLLTGLIGIAPHP